MIHYASFRHGGENYLAAGDVEDYLAVFVERSDGRYVRHGQTRWPSWAKFMHGETDNYKEGSVPDLEELERRYGVIIPSNRSDIFEDPRMSRWTDNPFQPPNAPPELLEWYAKRDEAIRVWRETGDDTMAIEIGLFPSKEEEEELEQMEANEPGAQMQVLKTLEADLDLTRLGEMLTEFDALAVLGVSRREEAHSSILAWLLNPRGNHLLGDFFLKNFLLETNAATAERVRDADWSNTEVRREWYNVVDEDPGRLDILILNQDAPFLCAIENKVFSGEHSGQLTRYRKALEGQYETYTRSHLFLTRHGTVPMRPKERCRWTPVDYGTILRLVERTIEHWGGRGTEGIMAFLRQYAKTLRRNIVPETETKRMANNLYLRHREAIDLIVDQKKAHIADLSGICREVTGQKTCWKLIGEREGGELVGFVHPTWRKRCVLRTGTNTTLGKQSRFSDSLLVLDFDFRVFGEVRLLLTMMEGCDEDARGALFRKTREELPNIFKLNGERRRVAYSTTTIRLYASEPILSGTDFIEGDRESWRKAIAAGVSGFKEEFPKMNEIILGSLKEIEGELATQSASAKGA